MLKIIRSKKYIIYLRNIYFIIDENVIFIEKKKKGSIKKKKIDYTSFSYGINL